MQTFSGTFFTESMQVSLGTLVHLGTLTVLGTLIGTFVQTFLVLYSQTSAPYPAGLGTQTYMEKMCLELHSRCLLRGILKFLPNFRLQCSSLVAHMLTIPVVQ